MLIHSGKICRHRNKICIVVPFIATRYCTHHCAYHCTLHCRHHCTHPCTQHCTHHCTHTTAHTAAHSPALTIAHTIAHTTVYTPSHTTAHTAAHTLTHTSAHTPSRTTAHTTAQTSKASIGNVDKFYVVLRALVRGSSTVKSSGVSSMGMRRVIHNMFSQDTKEAFNGVTCYVFSRIVHMDAAQTILKRFGKDIYVYLIKHKILDEGSSNDLIA